MFSRVLNKNLALLIKKKVALTDENCVVDVMVINDTSLTEKLTIKVQDLFHQHGQIFVVPSTRKTRKTRKTVRLFDYRR